MFSRQFVGGLAWVVDGRMKRLRSLIRFLREVLRVENSESFIGEI